MIKSIIALVLVIYVVFLVIYEVARAYKNGEFSKQPPVVSMYDFPYYHTVLTCPKCGHRFTDAEVDTANKCEVCHQKILWT